MICSTRRLHAGLRILPAILALLLQPAAAWAWLAPGHMATGAIAYDALERADPSAVEAISSIMQAHPDRARFERKLEGLEGPARARRLFELMARWPDDARRTAYDHPTWHYAEQVQSAVRYVLPFSFGNARGALRRELAIARDSGAPPGERAVALCWVFHIVGDLHEPLHTGMWMSTRFPLTDKGGTIAWVRTSASTRPETLHWFWDSAGAADPNEGRRRDAEPFATRVEAAHPPQAVAPPGEADRAAADWVRESRRIAASVVYAHGATPLASTPETAAVLDPVYVAQAQRIAEARLAQAGSRIAGLLVGVR